MGQKPSGGNTAVAHRLRQKGIEQIRAQTGAVNRVGRSCEAVVGRLA
jgi:hypothetical protein